jgi:hypothetical protein
MTYAANPFWQRVMAKPAEVPPEADPEPTLPASVRERSQWGQDVPTIDSLRSHGRYAEAVVEPATTRPADLRNTDGEPASPRSHFSAWQPYDYGNTFDE